MKIQKFIYLWLWLWIFISNTVLANNYSQELQDAYNFAYQNKITTINSIDNADMYWWLTRIAMAKMLSQYAINILWKTPDISRIPNFSDVNSELDNAYNNWVTLAYQLWIMWIWIDDFRPFDYVTRAEFGTALSRVLYWPKNEWWNPYYINHLKALQTSWIMTQINQPNQLEVRWYVMIMLMRSSLTKLFPDNDTLLTWNKMYDIWFYFSWWEKTAVNNDVYIWNLTFFASESWHKVGNNTRVLRKLPSRIYSFTFELWWTYDFHKIDYLRLVWRQDHWLVNPDWTITVKFDKWIWIDWMDDSIGLSIKLKESENELPKEQTLTVKLINIESDHNIDWSYYDWNPIELLIVYPSVSKNAHNYLLSINANVKNDGYTYSKDTRYEIMNIDFKRKDEIAKVNFFWTLNLRFNSDINLSKYIKSASLKINWNTLCSTMQDIGKNYIKLSAYCNDNAIIENNSKNGNISVFIQFDDWQIKNYFKKSSFYIDPYIIEWDIPLTIDLENYKYYEKSWNNIWEEYADKNRKIFIFGWEEFDNDVNSNSEDGDLSNDNPLNNDSLWNNDSSSDYDNFSETQNNSQIDSGNCVTIEVNNWSNYYFCIEKLSNTNFRVSVNNAEDLSMCTIWKGGQTWNFSNCEWKFTVLWAQWESNLRLTIKHNNKSYSKTVLYDFDNWTFVNN